MDKLKMEARPMDEVLKKVAAICPAAVQDNKIDFERLKQELAPELDDSAESYNFTWVGKRDAIIGAATPIRKTLLPCKAESKNWDTTKNLYIEGDNLDVLKLLQESYLGKVKVCYIDPPYNTGNDFVYCDDFADNCEEYLEKKGQCDLESHERLFKNDESNGRFHSNWCTMIYSRLKVARDLLADDGVIFISIDDHEQANLKKICDEIYGDENFITTFVWEKGKEGGNDSSIMRSHYDYILCYCKDSTCQNIINLDPKDTSRHISEDKEPNLVKGIISEKNKGELFQLVNLSKQKDYTVKIELIDGTIIEWPSYAPQTSIDKWIAEGKVFVGAKKVPYIKSYLKDEIQGQKPSNIITQTYGTTKAGSIEIRNFFGDKEIFSYPKPSVLIKRLLEIGAKKDSIVLDFFSGSATTAHAVMQLNAEDGGKRRFVMVQLAEPCDEKSEAFKAGYKNICEIGKERIRRAGDKIVAETGKSDLDIGFKVLKLADSNMEDVYYNPAETTQANLLAKVDNIKEGRTELDLLYGVMLDLGLTLDLDVAEVKSGKTTYYNVDNGSLVACFADNIPESIIKEIANLKPFRVVFKDSSFADAPSKINVTEIFKTLSPNTKITVL